MTGFSLNRPVSCSSSLSAFPQPSLHNNNATVCPAIRLALDRSSAGASGYSGQSTVRPLRATVLPQPGMAAGFPHNSSCTAACRLRRAPLFPPPLFFFFFFFFVCRTSARNTQRPGKHRTSSYTPRNDSPHELFQRLRECSTAPLGLNITCPTPTPCELLHSFVRRGVSEDCLSVIARMNLAKRTQKVFGAKVEGNRVSVRFLFGFFLSCQASKVTTAPSGEPRRGKSTLRVSAKPAGLSLLSACNSSILTSVTRGWGGEGGD